MNFPIDHGCEVYEAMRTPSGPPFSACDWQSLRNELRAHSSLDFPVIYGAYFDGWEARLVLVLEQPKRESTISEWWRDEDGHWQRDVLPVDCSQQWRQCRLSTSGGRSALERRIPSGETSNKRLAGR